MRARIAAVALAGCLGFAACEQLREELPTAPTLVPVTTPDTDRPTLPAPREPIVSTRLLDPTTVHPLFEDSFWQELIFNQYDEPGTLDERYRITLPFPSSSPNIYIWLADESGERVADPTWVSTVYETLPHLAEQLTGEPYRGRIEEGMADRSQRGWITVEFTTGTHDEFPHACGWAGVGGDPGRIWIPISEPHRLRNSDGCRFRRVFAHELGHAMGLRHVSDRTAVMAPASGPTSFNSREQYHAELLYSLGWGQRYCGWPFSPECAALNRDRSQAFRQPVIVVD